MNFGQGLFRFFVPLPVIAPHLDHSVAVAEHPSQACSFGRLGEQGEQMDERISSLTARFDELGTLREDFAAIIKPLDEFVVSHSKAQTRLMEQEALLAQHLNTTRSLRRELTELQTSAASAESELTGVRHHINILLQQAILDSETINRLKIEAGEHAARMSSHERQLATEIEKNAAMTDANRAKDAEMDEIDRQATASRARVAELFDELTSATVELERLHHLVDQMQPELARSKQRVIELETSLHHAELSAHASEAKVAQEQKEREQLLNRHTQEKRDLEASLSAMSLQVDAINSRHATTQRHLDQARSAHNEKIESALKWERSSKEGAAALLAAERRLTIAEEQIRILSEQSRSLEYSLAESASRGEMLAKAVAAKDVLLAQLQSKATNLESHYATLAQEREREQLQNESAKRRLVEALENEKAERALAQGALAIARTSREKLSTQVEALKRRRIMSDMGLTSAAEDGAEAANEEDADNNVHPFRPTDTQT